MEKCVDTSVNTIVYSTQTPNFNGKHHEITGEMSTNGETKSVKYFYTSRPMCTVCRTRPAEGETYKMHRFPKNIERCKKWLEILGMKDVSPKHAYTRFKICHKHFDRSMYNGIFPEAPLFPRALPRAQCNNVNDSDLLLKESTFVHDSSPTNVTPHTSPRTSPDRSIPPIGHKLKNSTDNQCRPSRPAVVRCLFPATPADVNSDVSDSANTSNITNMSNTYDTINLPNSATTLSGNRTSLPDITIISCINITPNTTNTNDTISLPNTTNTDDTINLPNTTNTDDTINLPNTSNTDDTISLPNTTNTDDTTNLPNTINTDDTINLPNTSNTDDTINAPRIILPKVSRPLPKNFRIKMQNTEKSKLKAKIRKLKCTIKKYKNKVNNLNGFDRNPVIQNFFSNLTPVARQLMISQIKNSKKKSSHGHRWLASDKSTALALLRRSPQCYAFLRKLIPFPSSKTLRIYLKSIPFSPGINHTVLNQLSKSIFDLKKENRVCCLIFDEMSIMPHFKYDSVSDAIEGFQDLGNGRRYNKVAKNALVFMVQGLRKRWKQPVAYYFVTGSMADVDLASIICEVIDAMGTINLDVVATVCDLGAANLRALKKLGATTSNPRFSYKNKTIYTVLDPPHLLKCTRNVFMKHNVQVNITVEGVKTPTIAKWDDIVLLYEKDKEKPLPYVRILRKITDAHINPQFKQKMKVSLAAQILSETVAAGISSLVESKTLPPRALATVSFLKDIDNLFDSLNASLLKPPEDKYLRGCLTDTSGHLQFWEQMIERIDSWKFLKIKTDSSVDSSSLVTRFAFQNGWIRTIIAVIEIWKVLSKRGFKYLCTRDLNQDPIENLFGSIRSSGGCNTQPTISQFVGGLKTRIVSGLTYEGVSRGNCEKDQSSFLDSLQNFLRIDLKSDVDSQESDSDTTEIPLATIMTVTAAVNRASFKIISVANISSYVGSQLLKNSPNCQECKTDLSSDSSVVSNQLTDNKANSDNIDYSPSENLVTTVGHILNILDQNLKFIQHLQGVRKQLVCIMEKYVDFSWLSCPEHSSYNKRATFEFVCIIVIPMYCRKYNHDLKYPKEVENEEKVKS